MVDLQKPQVGKKLSDARRSEDENGVVHQYVDMNAHSDNNADGCLLTIAPLISQVNKGIRWMPWRQEPMKDAVSCEKSRGAASRL